MALFTNQAQLSYSDKKVSSNVARGELIGLLSMTKTALNPEYTVGSKISYVLSIVNAGPSAYNNLTITDDLGGFEIDSQTHSPLKYRDLSVQYHVNGILQPRPKVLSGPPMVISGINVPAGGNAMISYEAFVTEYANPKSGGTIDNTATISGNRIATAVTASEQATADKIPILSIAKSVSPVPVTENGMITYTFVIENAGNTEAGVGDNVIITDTFLPVLSDISVTYNGEPWEEPDNYSYDTTSGEFISEGGQITVPPATFTPNTDGTYTVIPGTAVIKISGKI